MLTPPGHLERRTGWALASDPLFAQACRDVLGYLQAHLAMGFWAITRVENGRQTYLAVQDDVYGLRAGNSHEWQQSYCVHMAAGTGPATAPDAQAVPEYAAAGVNALVPIGAYAGSVIADADGGLFGAICGLDPHELTGARAEALTAAEPLLALLSRLLTTALAGDRQRHVLELRALQAELSADTDSLTGVHTRAAWTRLLATESLRYSELNDPTAIVIIDLDDLKATNDSQGHGAGDALLQRAAAAIQRGVRADDPVARLGGDEFGVLLRHCSLGAAENRTRDIRRQLSEQGVAASIGSAAAEPEGGLVLAQEAADRAMYADKQLRKGVDRTTSPRA